MKKVFTKEWFKAALVRAIKTAAQVALSMITLGAAIKDIDWVYVGSVAAVAFLYSIITSLAGLPEVAGDVDGTMLIDTTDPEVNRYLLQYNEDLEELANKKKVTFVIDANADLTPSDSDDISDGE